MNYKVNPVDIKCENELSDEMPMVKLGKINDQITVFNASECCRYLDIEPIDSVVFVKANRRFVEWVIEYRKLDTTKMFYITPSQDVLIDAAFLYCYLAYIDKNFFLYFTSLIEDVVRTGIALADGVILQQAATRLPKDILKQLAQDEIDS